MIKIYYMEYCQSSQKVTQWFDYHKIPYILVNIRYISCKELFLILSFTESGFLDILKNPKIVQREKRKSLFSLNSMSFNDGIKFIKKEYNLIRTPIIVDIDTHKIFVGYNKDELRRFIPRECR